jgi:N-acetylglutamate synthase-like GNAT family acetyltransferase
VISIRKANEEDAQAAWHIRNAAINSHCAGHYPPEALESWTRGDVTEDFVSAVVDSFYVATLDGEVVGTGMIDLDSGKVDAIFVHPNNMGTGVGSQILSYLEKLAIDAGLTQVNLESTLNAAPFYRACGFVGETVSKYKSPRGVSLDCIPMKKGLRSRQR